MKPSDRRPAIAPQSAFARVRFSPAVIMVAVRLYLRYGLSYRDVEGLLIERGIEVDHVNGCNGSRPCWLTRPVLPAFAGR